MRAEEHHNIAGVCFFVYHFKERGVIIDSNNISVRLGNDMLKAPRVSACAAMMAEVILDFF